jgi:hypothetical protein
VTTRAGLTDITAIFRSVRRPHRPRGPANPLRCRFRVVCGQFVEFRLLEARRAARLEVERAAQPRRVVLHGEFAVRADRIAAGFVAQVPKPAIADSDVADFVAQDHVEDRGGRIVACLHEPCADRRRRVEPARLERARHQRHPREHVVAGPLAHFPQAVVCREIAVCVTELGEPPAQQREMMGLFRGDLQPVRVERLAASRRSAIRRRARG